MRLGPTQKPCFVHRQRLIDLTGDQVMPSEKSISTSVMAHFPDLQTEYNSLDGDLRELGLSGSDRVYAISQAISGLIKGDGSSAPQQLGLVECPLNRRFKLGTKS